MNVYHVVIGFADERTDKVRHIHVLAESVADANEKAMEFLKDDYDSAIPEDISDYAPVAVERLMYIDWPKERP